CRPAPRDQRPVTATPTARVSCGTAGRTFRYATPDTRGERGRSDRVEVLRRIATRTCRRHDRNPPGRSRPHTPRAGRTRAVHAVSILARETRHVGACMPRLSLPLRWFGRRRSPPGGG